MATRIILLEPVNQACLSLDDVLTSPYYVWNGYYLVPQLELDITIAHTHLSQHVVFVCAYHVLSLPATSKSGTVWLIPLNRGGISGTIFQIDHVNTLKPLDFMINLTNVIDERAFELKKYTLEMIRINELSKWL